MEKLPVGKYSQIPKIIWLGLAFLAGALSILSYAPFRYYFLMPLWLGVLLLLIYYFPTRAAKYAYLWGFGAFITQCYWVNTAINVFGNVPKFISIPLTLLLPLYLAIYPMMAVWISRRFRLSMMSQIIVVLPMAWVIMDYLRGRLLTGFGWGTLGYSQAASSPLIGYASIGGILMVTYVVVLITALLFYACIRKATKYKICALSMVVLLIALGQLFKSINFTTYDSTAKVGLAQVNIAQDIKFNYETIAASIAKFQKLLVNYPDIDILFFPETSVPISWENLSPEEKQTFIDYTRKYNTSLALGTFKRIPSAGLLYNAVIGIDPINELADINDYPFYAKHHLVPFGEYKPFFFLSDYIFKALNLDLGEINAGPEEQAVITLGNQDIAFNICYEEIFGDELVELAKESSLIANASNMAWYGSSYAMDLQLQQGQARAMELGRYVVRATNTGYSAIIDNKGQIMSYLDRDQFGVLVGEIKGFRGQTPYMKMGGSFYWIISLFLLLLVLFFYTRNRSNITINIEEHHAKSGYQGY